MKKLLTTLLLLAATGVANATPWIPVGDMRAKHSVQWLSDRGCFSAPTNTWPLMWADLSAELDNKNAPQECQQSMAWRYLKFERNFHRDSESRLSLKAGHASYEPLFRGFADAPREKAQYQISLDIQKGPFVMGASPTYVHNPRDGDEWRADQSFIAGKLGNWILGVGAIDRWWGPGWQSNGILTNNARPIPGVWINRHRANPSSIKPFSWLGSWDFTAFAGEMESNRHIPNTKLIGARFSFKPFQWIELGASRTAQWGGDGEPSNGKSLFNAIIGRDNGQRGKGKDPANQLGGFDVRLAAPLSANATGGFYMQMIGEDEAGGMPAKYNHMAGIDLATRLAQGEQRFYFEAVDNLAGSWFSDDAPAVMYNHSRYKTGYRYKGRAVGSTWEGDNKSYTLGATHFFPNGHELTATASRVELAEKRRNWPTDVPTPYVASPKDQNFSLFSLGYSFNLLGGQAGRVTLTGQFSDKKLQTINTEDQSLEHWAKFNGMASWEYRFD